MTFTLSEFLRLTGGTYTVSDGWEYGNGPVPVHRFSFPNGSVIMSAPGETHADALRHAAEFIFGQAQKLPELVREVKA